MVISNRPGVQGLKRASLAGIQTRVRGCVYLSFLFIKEVWLFMERLAVT